MELWESKRLTFRPVVQSDYGFFSSFLSDPECAQFLPLGRSYSNHEVQAYLEERLAHWASFQFGTWILELKKTGAIIGYCGLEHVGSTAFIDIRYGVNRAYRGRGLAVEAANSCLRVGFDYLDLPIIYGAVCSQNEASVAILKRLGMRTDSSVQFYGDSVEYYSIGHAVYERQYKLGDLPSARFSEGNLKEQRKTNG